MSTTRVGPSSTDHLFGRPGGRGSEGAAGAGHGTAGHRPTLRDLRRQFEDAGREADRIATGLSSQQVNWRPRSGQWSIAECFGHLNILGSEMLPLIDAAISEARSRGWYGSGTLRPGFLARRLLKATEPPVRRRRRALDAYVPHSDEAARDVVAALVDLNGLLSSRLQAADGLDVSRPKISAPAASRFRLSLYELLLYLAAHARRHLAQARAVKEHSLFPKAPAAPEHARPAVPPRPAR